MADSIREQVCEHLETIFTAMDASLPVDDPYGVSFSKVEREEVGQLQPGKASALGIYDVAERKNHKFYPTTECYLTVLFEFHLHISTSSRPSKELNKYATAIERKLYEDQTLGGLSYDIIIQGTEYDIDGPYDKQVSGVLETVIRYRHKTGDPRTKGT